MKLNRGFAKLFISLTVLGAAGQMSAKQPYTGCWYPDDIIDWTPEKYADAPFNRSFTPLAPRMTEPELMKAQQTQSYIPQICDATILFPTCGSSPSLGSRSFTGYSPTYWQYMDKVVYWAGSAGEGIICPPPVHSIDAAHRNGVKILGNVFFAPSEYGGKGEWVTQMLTQVDGKYIYAIKLFEIARWHGFDGWFINKETTGGTNLQWAAFVKEFQDAADAAGCPWMEIQWYDAKTRPNVDILKVHPNVSQFLEYGAIVDHSNYAPQIGCSEEDLFSRLYCGIECVKAKMTGYGYYLKTAFGLTSGKPIASVDLFCPEEHIWKEEVSSLLGTADEQGEAAYEAQRRVFANENAVWVNKNGDVTTATTDWVGISSGILERSAVTALPFTSYMSNGLGKHRFVEGQAVATGDWWDPGMQSVLPTWRWWFEGTDAITVTENWDNAWAVGSAYDLTGAPEAGEYLWRLYKTAIEPEEGSTLRMVSKTAEGVELIPIVTAESSVSEGLIPLTLLDSQEVNGWTVARYDLSPLAGKTLYMVALNVKVAEGLDGTLASLGEISLLNGEAASHSAVTNLANQTEATVDGIEMRLTWDYDETPEHFNVYVSDSRGRRLAWQTRAHACYIPKIERLSADEDITVTVQPVFADGYAPEAQLRIEYPELTAPTTDMKTSSSYAKLNDIITINAPAWPAPESWKWTCSDGLAIDEQSGSQCTFRCTALGMQNVTVEVSNRAGSTTLKKDMVDVLTDEQYSQVGNVAQGKKVLEYNGSANSKEVPSKMLDGKKRPTNISDKWCVVNSTDNYVIIDLGENYCIYGFKIYDCKSGPENYENCENYRIALSSDLKEWNTVVDETGRGADNIKEDYIGPTIGRYVRLQIWSEIPFTMRLWEFEVIGMPDHSGIDGIEADATFSVTPSAAATGEGFDVTAHGQVSIFAADGMRVEGADIDGTARMGRTLPAGVYLVTDGRHARKVIIR